MWWDSNPRLLLQSCGFQDRRLKPLGHTSRWGPHSLLQGRDPVKPTHVRNQGGRHAYAPVRLLVILQDGDEGAADGEARTVDGVQDRGALFAGALEAQAQAARLEVPEVRAGADLP